MKNKIVLVFFVGLLIFNIISIVQSANETLDFYDDFQIVRADNNQVKSAFVGERKIGDLVFLLTSIALIFIFGRKVFYR
jgi:hypothetical protein